MLAGFWQSAGGKLLDRYAAVSAPALVFWLGALLAWIAGHHGLGRLNTITSWLNRQSSPVQLIAIALVLVALLASVLVVQRLTLPVLRALEGYWPRRLDGLRRRLVEHTADRLHAPEARWQELYPRVQPPQTPTWAELTEFTRLDRARRRRPTDPNRLMPTRIGNILRAAEIRPNDHYGLDAVIVWPHLWLLLPDSARQELAASRASLDAAVASTIWGLLFCVFAVWTLWAIPAGLLVCLGAVRWWAPERAATFGELFSSAYDLYRTSLYQQLRWPLPTNPSLEPEQGREITAYLWRGSDDTEPTFVVP